VRYVEIKNTKADPRERVLLSTGLIDTGREKAKEIWTSKEGKGRCMSCTILLRDNDENP
jgi:hypothetical protein